MTDRTATIQRDTSETKIKLSINLDGTGKATTETGVGFFDHMLDLLARHSLIDMDIQAQGDLHIDAHHTVEDVGIVLGQAIAQAIGDKRGIRRYGFFILPMDEALAQVAVDLSGRAALVFDAPFSAAPIGSFDPELVREFMTALANNARMNLHIHVPYGANNHHIAEAIFKALAKSLRMAVDRDPRNDALPSTKGML